MKKKSDRLIKINPNKQKDKIINQLKDSMNTVEPKDSRTTVELDLGTKDKVEEKYVRKVDEKNRQGTHKQAVVEGSKLKSIVSWKAHNILSKKSPGTRPLVPKKQPPVPKS